jgi:hypothetical protein
MAKHKGHLGGERGQGRWTVNVAPCPRCGADMIEAGELTFWRGEVKWHGPYLAFACGTMIVVPALRMAEFWNMCNRDSRGVINVKPEDVKVGPPKDPPLRSAYEVGVARFMVEFTTSATTTGWQ